MAFFALLGCRLYTKKVEGASYRLEAATAPTPTFPFSLDLYDDIHILAT